jgi:hypothetical protein
MWGLWVPVGDDQDRILVVIQVIAVAIIGKLLRKPQLKLWCTYEACFIGTGVFEVRVGAVVSAPPF